MYVKSSTSTSVPAYTCRGGDQFKKNIIGMSALGVGLVFALQVGTGGYLSIEYLRARGDKGYSYPAFERAAASAHTLNLRSTVEHLDHIKSSFSISVTDLADAFGVTRQAIYDWQSGKPIADSNSARIEELSRVVDLLLDHGIDDKRLLKRAIRDGENFLQIMAQGQSIENAAQDLIKILQREQKEQDKMAARMAKRQKPALNVLNEAGTPASHEEA